MTPIALQHDLESASDETDWSVGPFDEAGQRKGAWMILRRRQAEALHENLMHFSGPLMFRSPTVERAEREMHHIGTDTLGKTGISERTQRQVLAFLARISRTDSIPASIAPDDDGIAVLHWVTGDVSLQVDVFEDGPDYLWFADGESRYSTQRPQAIHNVARHALRKMTNRVVTHRRSI
jgi:hypothetical protein